MRIVDTRVTDVLAELRKRAVTRDAESERIVAEIIADVADRGNQALLENVRRFDAPDIASIAVGMVERDSGMRELSREAREALMVAFANVFRFHETQRDILLQGLDLRRPPESIKGQVQQWHHFAWERPFVPTDPDSGTVGQRFMPLRSVGVYVPGGQAAYPSSVLMNVAPAVVAGVPHVFVATPPRRDGSLPPAVRAMLAMTMTAGAVKVGGAAAIAMFALGTETFPRVDKVVGPGNRFVNEAKRQLFGRVGIDGYAGPSEVCVLVDDSSDASFAAADLLTQVEHAADNAGFLVSLSEAKIREVLAEVDRQLAGAPRAAIIREALENESLAVLVRDESEAIDVVNAIAPEHLSVGVREPDRVLGYIRNAACILVGPYTPQSAADYCLGPSHTLPTSGAARWQSALNVLDFLKVQSIARLTEADLELPIPVIERMADLEGFPAHARDATIRRRE